MPIKLADVIENIDSNFGIIETSKHNIVGLYNGSVGAVPSLEIYHNGNDVKTALTSDGGAVNRIQVYKLPFAQNTATNYVTGTDTLKLETRKGGLISVHDGKLNGGNGGEAVYLVQQDPTVGNASDATRSDITRFTELVQDFDMYESITGATAHNSDGDFFLAGYDAIQKKTRKLTIQSLFEALAAELATGLINDGIITTAQAGGSGVVGDFNNDGLIGTSDLILFLGAFGNGSDVGFESNVAVLTGSSETVGPLSPVFVNPASSFSISNLTTFQLPTSLTQSGQAFGFSSITRAAVQANFIKFNNSTITSTTASSHWINRSVQAEVTVTANFSASDALHALAHIELTGQDASETTFEVMAYMSYENNGVPAEGAHTVGYYGNAGGAGSDGLSIDTDHTFTFYANFAPTAASGGYQGNSTFTPLTNFDDHQSVLANGFNMATMVNGGYIEDVQLRIFFTSQTENVTVTVNTIRFIIVPHQ